MFLRLIGSIEPEAKRYKNSGVAEIIFCDGRPAEAGSLGSAAQGRGCVAGTLLSPRRRIRRDRRTGAKPTHRGRLGW
jgi:hypothetical protein